MSDSNIAARLSNSLLEHMVYYAKFAGTAPTQVEARVFAELSVGADIASDLLAIAVRKSDSEEEIEKKAKRIEANVGELQDAIRANSVSSIKGVPELCVHLSAWLNELRQNQSRIGALDGLDLSASGRRK